MKKQFKVVLLSAMMTMGCSLQAKAQWVVYDPVSNLTDILKMGKDIAAWASDYALQEYNNLSTTATNTGQIAEILAKLRDSEMSEEAIAKVRDLVKEFTFGVVDVDIDLGDLTMNQNVLLEVLTEKLSESMAYKKAVSSRMDDVLGVIKERYPEAEEVLSAEMRQNFYENGNKLTREYAEESIRGKYDSGAATMRANSELLIGLADADATLKELRSDVLDDTLGTNSMLRRIMKGSLVAAENTRATAEAITLFTDLQAQQMIEEASSEARGISKFVGRAEGYKDNRKAELEALDSIKPQAESYWIKKAEK